MFTNDTMLIYHLENNHYPPVSRVFADAAKKAIQHMRDDEPDAIVELPNGITKHASEVVAELHLEYWLDMEESEVN